MRLQQDQHARDVPGADPADYADPAHPPTVLPAALLPRRVPGGSLSGRQVNKVQRQVSPEILFRVIAGLERL